eukprot:UN06586
MELVSMHGSLLLLVFICVTNTCHRYNIAINTTLPSIHTLQFKPHCHQYIHCHQYNIAPIKLNQTHIAIKLTLPSKHTCHQYTRHQFIRTFAHKTHIATKTNIASIHTHIFTNQTHIATKTYIASNTYITDSL